MVSILLHSHALLLLEIKVVLSEKFATECISDLLPQLNMVHQFSIELRQLVSDLQKEAISENLIQFVLRVSTIPTLILLL